MCTGGLRNDRRFDNVRMRHKQHRRTGQSKGFDNLQLFQINL